MAWHRIEIWVKGRSGPNKEEEGKKEEKEEKDEEEEEEEEDDDDDDDDDADDDRRLSQFHLPYRCPLVYGTRES